MSKKFFILLQMLVIAFAICSCTKDDVGPVPTGMKRVTLKAETAATKASISDEGVFAWQADDEISVLATDGKYYVLTYTDGSNNEFSGVIPESAQLSGVAVYPALFEDGSANKSYDATTGHLTFTLPETYDHVVACTNVPMVAVVEEGASRTSFKQVASLVKFTFKNVPNKVKFVAEFPGKDVVGDFDFDVNELGKAGIVAKTLEGSSSSVVVNYNVEESSDEMTLYIPVPTGKYSEFKISAYEVENDGTESVIYSKSYTKDGYYDLSRGKMFITKDLLVSKVIVSSVTPGYSDVKVQWNELPDVDGYALIIDGETVGTFDAATKSTSFAGQFGVNETHEVQVAPIYNNVVSLNDASDVQSFTTANLEQYQAENMNVGPTHVTIAFTDLGRQAGGDGNSNVYQIQLFAENDVTSDPIYDVLTVDKFSAGKGSLGGTSWYGKANGTNYSSPSRVSLGGLQPNTTYYVRIKTAPKQSVVTNVGKTANVSSKFGESEFSALVPVKTAPAHVAGTNEVLFEGFDDITLNADFVNLAQGLIPNFGPEVSVSSGVAFAQFANVYQFPWKPEWLTGMSIQNFSNTATVVEYGMVDPATMMFKNTGSSLNGWTAETAGELLPGYGFMRIGNTSATNVSMISPALTEGLSDTPQVCRVTFKACPLATTHEPCGLNVRVDYYIPKDGEYVKVEGNVITLEKNYDYQDASNYTRYYAWQDVTAHVMLAKGWKVGFTKVGCDYMTRFAFDDLKVELAPSDVYDGAALPDLDEEEEVSYYTVTPSGQNYAYQPFGFDNKIPITYWYGPTGEYINEEVWSDMEECGINTVTTSTIWGMNLDVAKKEMELSYNHHMKYIGHSGFSIENAPYYNKESSLAYLDSYAKMYKDADFNPYVGDYFGDEPNYTGIPTYIQHIEDYRSHDPYYEDKIPYLNIYPSYASPAQLGSTMPEYYAGYAAVPNCRLLSFDSYPYNATKLYGDMRGDIFRNYDLARVEANRNHIPFMAIMQGHTELGYILPREVEIRWQAWMALSFGAKALSYYCYWEVPTEDARDVYLCNGDNTKNVLWYYAKGVNSIINNYLGEKLINCHADGVIQHKGKYNLYGEAHNAYGPLNKVSGSPSITGCFHDDKTGAFKFLVTHLQTSYAGNSSSDVTLHFDNNVTGAKVYYTKNGTENTVNITDHALDLTIPEGEAYYIELILSE